MLTVHHVNAVLVIAVCATAGVAALVARRRGAGGWMAHLLALAQTLLVAQVGLGLLLLADHKRAGERLHYVYGAVALLAVDLGWFFVVGVSGLDALVFFLVAGACVYAGVRTWRDQRRYG